MAEVPVSPALLRWAREYRGLSESEAAKRLGMSLENLRAYEEGQRLPTVTAFENFATKYKLPQATLFRSSPPKLPPSPVDFRTLGGVRSVGSFEYQIALSEVRSLLAELRRIAADDEEFKKPELPQFSQSDDPERVGALERTRIGPTVDEQLSWQPGEAFRRWRALVEKQRVSVFLKKYPWSDSRGFSLYDFPETPAIVVNKNEDAEVARSFSLLHEYAHLLIRRPGVSDHNPSNPVESFCNRFAASFLMPDAALRRVLPYWPNRPVEWDRSSILSWSRKLKVSQPALALRLEQAGLAPVGFYARYSRPNQAPPQKRTDGKPSYVTTRLSELGGNYPTMIMDALDRRIISDVTAVEALGLRSEHFERVRASVARQASLAAA